MSSIKYSHWFSQGAYSFLNRMSVLFFGFGVIFFMVRMMPKEAIGIWVLFTSVTAILEMIRHGFIRNPFITLLVAAEKDDKDKIITTSFVLHTALAVVISILLILAAKPLSKFWDAPGLDILFYLYSINNLIFIPFLHFEYLQTAESNFKAIFLSNFWRLGLPCLYVVVIFFVRHQMTLVELVNAQIFATIIGAAIAYVYVRDIAKTFSKVDRKLMSELFHFGKYTFGTQISSMFVKNTDSWMIGRLISTAGVAIYNPALRISNLVEVPTLTIANMIFPRVPQKMKEEGVQGVRDIYYKSVSLILAAMIPMVVPIFIFAELVITLVFGPQYVDSAPILRVTIFYSLIIPFNRQFGTLMDGLKKPQLNFYLLVMVAVLNVIFNFIFLRWFGLIGSAYATLTSYLIVFILNQLILHKLYRINTLKVFEGLGEWYKLGWEVFRKRIVKLA